MLHEFLTVNRDELIRRCRGNEAKRFAPSNFPKVFDHGVPLFLQQLIDTLRHEQLTRAGKFAKADPAPVPSSIGRAAALQAFSAVRSGSIGFSGATGTVLMHTLLELRDLAKTVGEAARPRPSWRRRLWTRSRRDGRKPVRVFRASAGRRKPRARPTAAPCRPSSWRSRLSQSRRRANTGPLSSAPPAARHGPSRR